MRVCVHAHSCARMHSDTRVHVAVFMAWSHEIFLTLAVSVSYITQNADVTFDHQTVRFT